MGLRIKIPNGNQQIHKLLKTSTQKWEIPKMGKKDFPKNERPTKSCLKNGQKVPISMSNQVS